MEDTWIQNQLVVASHISYAHKIALRARRIEWDCEIVGEVYWLIQEDLCVRGTALLGSQFECIGIWWVSLGDGSAADSICIRMRQQFYLFGLKSAIGIIESMLPWRIRRTSRISIILELPPKPILPTIFRIAKNSLDLLHPCISFRGTSKLCQHTTAFQSIYFAMSFLHIRTIENMAFCLGCGFSMRIFPRTVTVIRQDIKMLELRWRRHAVKAREKISREWIE